MAGYVFDQAWQQERERLAALEGAWDPYTMRELEALGVGGGWRCLEVGAGGGSIAAWLGERVAPSGRVLATDLDTRFVALVASASVEVRRHDIVADDLPEAAFDLVHARLLLEHLEAPGRALERMVAALKPGGVLFVEEFDHAGWLPDPATPAAERQVWLAFFEAFGHLAEARRIDLAYGRRLLAELEGRGLEGVVAIGRAQLVRGGSHVGRLLSLSVDHLRAPLTATGAIDGRQVDRLIALLDDPCFCWTSQLMVQASGRKPR